MKRTKVKSKRIEFLGFMKRGVVQSAESEADV